MLDENVRRSARLVKRLNSTSPTEARQAAKDIEAILWPRHPTHVRVLQWDEWRAIQEDHFRRVRESEVIVPLLESLRSGTTFARCFLLTNLSAIGEQRVLPALWDALWDPEPSVRSAAARSSLILQKPESIPRLIELLRDEDSEVVLAASGTLGQSRAAAAIEPLLELFKHRDWNRRKYALRALSEMREPCLLSLFREALRDKHKSVRKTAKLALASIDSARRQKLKQNPPQSYQWLVYFQEGDK